MSIGSEINRLGQEKTALNNAITAKGGTLADGAELSDFAAAVAGIKKCQVVNGSISGDAATTHSYGGTSYPSCKITISGLPFRPKGFCLMVGGANNSLTATYTTFVWCTEYSDGEAVYNRGFARSYNVAGRYQAQTYSGENALIYCTDDGFVASINSTYYQFCPDLTYYYIIWGEA